VFYHLDRNVLRICSLGARGIQDFALFRIIGAFIRAPINLSRPARSRKKKRNDKLINEGSEARFDARFVYSRLSRVIILKRLACTRFAIGTGSGPLINNRDFRTEARPGPLRACGLTDVTSQRNPGRLAGSSGSPIDGDPGRASRLQATESGKSGYSRIPLINKINPMRKPRDGNFASNPPQDGISASLVSLSFFPSKKAGVNHIGTSNVQFAT